MERFLMSLPSYDEEGTIDMNAYRQQQDEDDYEGTIDMSEYSNSKEAQEASTWDYVKEAGIQSALGFAKSYTWPADVLKLAMVGEGLTDIDDIEEAFKKEGKKFDKDKYIKTVFEQGEFIPTQELLQDIAQKKTGINLEPKTKIGKSFNKLFFLGGLAKGKGFSKEAIKKGAKAGATGSATTAALRETGAPDLVSELGGDLASGVSISLSKQARKISPEAKRLQDVADKHGLPFMEAMLKDEISPSAKISIGRKQALEKKLGMSTEEAIKGVIEDRIPLSRLKNSGVDLEVLETEAYDKVKELASKNPKALNAEQIGTDIDREVARIKSLAPSPSDAQKAALKILEGEKDLLSSGKATTEQLVNQTQNYNSNVKSIYRKPEFSGVENEVKNAYAFLNNSIRNNIESQSGKEVIDSLKAANRIHGETASLARTEGLVNKAFKDGKYSAKKLNQVLDSKQGTILRRDIGEQGVKELRDIAKFGQQAQAATAQYANSAKHKFNVSQWGPLAGFILAKVPLVGVGAAYVKPVIDYVRGWTLTNPAARTELAKIMKNASNGQFKNMAKDFAGIESEMIKEYGSIEEFMKQGIKELQFYREGEEDEV